MPNTLSRSIYLAPLLAEFARRYPGIIFEFDLTPRRVDPTTSRDTNVCACPGGRIVMRGVTEG
ncbi:hypothetical protein GRB70_00790 [Bradyrhizobium neotropicale]|nr:hypothetical protein [Bradyrhizobium neotropicale]